MIRLLFITDEAFFFNNVWCMVYIFCIPPHERDGELTFGVFLCDGGKPKKKKVWAIERWGLAVCKGLNRPETNTEKREVKG